MNQHRLMLNSNSARSPAEYLVIHPTEIAWSFICRVPCRVHYLIGHVSRGCFPPPQNHAVIAMYVPALFLDMPRISSFSGNVPENQVASEKGTAEFEASKSRNKKRKSPLTYSLVQV
jgi:hypothetical protein